MKTKVRKLFIAWTDAGMPVPITISHQMTVSGSINSRDRSIQLHGASKKAQETAAWRQS